MRSSRCARRRWTAGAENPRPRGWRRRGGPRRRASGGGEVGREPLLQLPAPAAAVAPERRLAPRLRNRVEARFHHAEQRAAVGRVLQREGDEGALLGGI